MKSPEPAFKNFGPLEHDFAGEIEFVLVLHQRYPAPEYFRRMLFSHNDLICVEEASPESFIRDIAADRTERLTPGKLIFIPCGLPFEYRLSTGDLLSCYQFRIRTDPFHDLYDGDNQLRTGFDPDFVAAAREPFFETDAVRSLCMFKALTLRFCLSNWPDTARRSELEPEYVQLCRHIEGRIDARTSVADMADFLHLPQNVFSKRFRRMFGIPPKNWLQKLLMQRVIGCFDSGCNVRVTARQLGFSSEYYLSRFFKSGMGMAPRDFIRSRGVGTVPKKSPFRNGKASGR